MALPATSSHRAPPRYGGGAEESTVWPFRNGWRRGGLSSLPCRSVQVRQNSPRKSGGGSPVGKSGGRRQPRGPGGPRSTTPAASGAGGARLAPTRARLAPRPPRAVREARVSHRHALVSHHAGHERCGRRVGCGKGAGPARSGASPALPSPPTAATRSAATSPAPSSTSSASAASSPASATLASPASASMTTPPSSPSPRPLRDTHPPGGVDLVEIDARPRPRQ